MYIDIDSHIFPREAMQVLYGQGFKSVIDKTGRERIVTYEGSMIHYGPENYNLDIRLAAMREAGFDKQLLISEQGFVPDYVPLLSSVKLARAYNDSVAEIQKRHEEFIACAEVPHQDPSEAIREAKRAVNDLGLKAIRIFGTWCGKNIESDEWWPFFETVDELKIPLMVHPHGTAGQGKLNPNIIAYEHLTSLGHVTTPTGERKPVWLSGLCLGFPIEAMFVIAGLVLHDVLKQYPNLKLVIQESGVSWAPFIAARLDFAKYQLDAKRSFIPDIVGNYVPISIKPSEYVKKHFWWTLDHPNEEVVPSLIRDYGMSERLLAQTDFPHPEGILEIPAWVEKMPISRNDKDRILGKNAEELLRIN